ncbi:MAG TPA: host attachment protein [Burkholderiaceae bacterium]|nr:host attachment protein [Burkholderiaceae bacterium]
MNHPTWIVVADEGSARLVEYRPDDRSFDVIETLADPLAHARNADLQRDASGRRGTAAHAASITTSAGLEASHQEAVNAARRVVERLSSARNDGRFDALIIVAAPRFLGLLRNALTKDLQPLVKDEQALDLAGLPEPPLFERLREFVRPGPRA